MEYTQLGKTDFKVSRIALGSWGLGSDFYGEVELNTAIDTLHAAVDSGINIVDTAPNYGNSEEVLGKALAGIRDKVIVATKCGCLKYPGGSYKLLTPVSMRLQLEESLRRLNTDYIDLYQIHYPDKNSSMEAAYDTMNKFVEEGKIRAWGVCNHSVSEALNAADAGAVSLQAQYSLSKRAIERDLLPVAKANDMSVIAYGTLIGGLLSGKYNGPKTISATDRRPMFYTEFKEENWPKSEKLIAAVREVAENRGESMPNVAINWALSNANVGIALVGAKTAAQAEANAKAAAFSLTKEEVAKLNAASF
ncbi:MAG: aldo/keto reductase [Lachnospiraceae bacterium]|nr:aldo/keto reductase [Lachnospiraceae bacterium]